jgi:hypothetical protein
LIPLAWRCGDRCFVRGEIARIRALYLRPRSALVRTETGWTFLVLTRELDLVPLPETAARGEVAT